MDLILVRHGQTDWNLQGRWQGQADPSLNATGIAQAQAAADALCADEFAALYSSDLKRAWETADQIAALKHLTILPEPRLREINLGAWQGMFSPDIRAQYPQEFQQWHNAPLYAHPPGGEDLRALIARVLAALADLRARHSGEQICVVAHELPIAVIRCHAAALPFEHLREFIPANGSITRVKG